jgi:hypothetical protein
MQKTSPRNSIIILFCILAGINQSGSAQFDYRNYKDIQTTLQDLHRQYASITGLESIGKSYGGKEIWAFEIKPSNSAKEPAILVVAGADGALRSGTELSLKMIESILQQSSGELNNTLNGRRIFFIPSLSPDAIELYKDVKYLQSGNARPMDSDRDGKTQEDPVEDLDRNGLITAMRVLSPDGQYKISEDDPRLMVKIKNGEVLSKRYRILTEGIDNDKDGKFNEDGPGGVNIDMNFAFDYPIFEDGAGPYSTSESEARNFLDFIHKNPEIFMVIHLGSADNLLSPPVYDEKKTKSRIITGILEHDSHLHQQISEYFKEISGLQESQSANPGKGSLSNTVYFHAGKYSIAALPWLIPAEEKEDKGEEAEEDKKTMRRPGKSKEKEKNYELQYLKWAEKENVQHTILEWKEFNHPDFPNQVVELGGIIPHALQNPPAAYLEKPAQDYVQLLGHITKNMPKISIVNSEVEKIDGELYRLTVKFFNDSPYPAYSGISEKIRYSSKLKVIVKDNKDQTIKSGKRVNVINGGIKPGEVMEYSWLIHGKGDAIIEIGCATTGTQNLKLALK